MPRIAIIADVHGNLHALVAVMREAEESGINKVVFGGDLVGYGALPSACVRLAMQYGAGSVLGNHDQLTAQIIAGVTMGQAEEYQRDTVLAGARHAAKTLSAREAEWLASLPYTHKFDGVILVHSSLNEPDQWDYVETEADAAPSLEFLRGRKRHVAFCGHTHVQRCFKDSGDARELEWLDQRRFRIPHGLATLVTVGSVGQPRSEDDDMRASWTVWDSETRIVEFRRTEYDNRAAAATILEAGLPEESAIRLL